MDFKKYQVLAERTRPTTKTRQEELANYALGMVCEAGEAGDIIKKVVYHNHALNDIDMKKELGDVLWYIANLCTVLGYSLEDVATMNIEKLKKRYPNGFNTYDSVNRVD